MVMRFSNFTLDKTLSSGIDKKFLASVDVTTGHFFWKRTVRRPLMREIGGYWYFADTGAWVPRGEINRLERAYLAKKEL